MTQFASKVGSPDAVTRESNFSVMTDERPAIEFDESLKMTAGAIGVEIYLRARRLRIIRN
jgi:hypothetical protein